MVGSSMSVYYPPEVKSGVLTVGGIPVSIRPSCQDMGSKDKKHLRGSTQAIIHPLAITLTAALQVSITGSIVVLILPPLCFLYY